MGSYKKKLFIVLLLISLIGFFVCSSSFATMQDVQYSVDQPTLLKEQQEYLASAFIKKLNIINDTTFTNNFKTWCENDSYWPMFSYSVYNNVGYFTVHFLPITIRYETLDTYTIDTDDAYFEDYYFSYPVSGFQVNPSDFNSSSVKRFTLQVQGSSHTELWYTGGLFIPSSIILYNNKTINNYINGIEPSQSSIAMIINAIQENTDEQEQQTEEMKKLNNFMSSEDVDEDAYDMPTDNPTTDITESGVNGIFTMFYDKINNWESENITIRIPFANKIFIIPSDLTENIVNSYLPNTTTFGRLFGLIWYYLLGVYIVKDIQKYIDGLQTGEILTKSDTNIKTEML